MTYPLAQYRKKSAGAAAEATPPKGPDEYVAFDAKDKVDRLLIRSAKVQARSPGYEAVLSSQIEGTQSTLEDVLQFEIDATLPPFRMARKSSALVSMSFFRRNPSKALDCMARAQRVLVESLPCVCICPMTLCHVRWANAGSPAVR